MLNKKEIIYATISVLLATVMWACQSEDEPVSQSVIGAGETHRTATELDKWIQDSITTPYNIAVQYRWDKNVAPNVGRAYPPEPDNVKAVLRTIKTLWIDLYTHAAIGGKDFLKDKKPLKIYLFGGGNIDRNGVPLLNNAAASNVEMYLFNVNEFDAANPDKVYILMRSVHHQFAKRLAEVFPYRRDEFASISPQWYTGGSTASIRTQLSQLTSPVMLYQMARYANQYGLFTLHSLLSAEDEFAEIVSIHLMHPAKDITAAMTYARTPLEGATDPETAAAEKAFAEARYSEMLKKKTFVEDYFTKTVGIPLANIQLLSVKKVSAYGK